MTIKGYIPNEIFGYGVTFWICSFEEAMGMLDQHLSQNAVGQFYSTISEDADAAFFEDLDGFTLLWIRDKQDLPLEELFKAITHECVHIAVCLTKSRGIPINAENQELLSYLTAYYFDKCFEIINKELDESDQPETELEG